MGVMTKWWFKYLVSICLLGIGINLLYISVPLYLTIVYDRVLFSFSVETLVTLTLGLILTLATLGGLVFLRAGLLAKAGAWFERELATPILKAMHNRAVLAPSGDHEYTRGLEDISVIRRAISNASLFPLIDAPWVIIYLAALFFIHPIVACVAVGGVIICLFIYAITLFFSKGRYTKAQVVMSAGRQYINETLDQADVVSGMGFFPGVTRLYFAKQDKASNRVYSAELFKAVAESGLQFVSLLSMAGVYTAGAYLFFNDSITAGVMMAVVLLTARVFMPLTRTFNALEQRIEAGAAYKRLKMFAANMQAPHTPLELPRPEGKLLVEGATLVLNGRRMLQNINFGVEPGEILCITGPSAAGKTQLLKLILGLVPPTSGKIRLDGADTFLRNKDDLGKYVGYVPHKPVLFSGRVDENVARLEPVDSEKVVTAAKNAHVHDAILKLPEGYNTLVGKAGQKLSSGQVMRIACARALYNDPSLLVLDRPNADLDEQGMVGLFKTMVNFKKQNKTVVMVTENPRFMANSDKLLFLKDGQVIAFGPAKEVLSKLTNRQSAQQE